MSARRARFVAGDPLRAVAALSVLGFHAAYTALPVVDGRRDTGSYEAVYGDWPGHVLGSLDMGLYVFFVLSGYLLSAPFLRAAAAGDPGPQLRGYARNRLLRIVPAFWAVLALTLLYFGLRRDGPGDLLAVFAFLQTYVETDLGSVIGQAWTLHVELGFYLLLPLATWLLVRAGVRRLLVFAGLAGAVFCASYLAKLAGPATDSWTRSIPAMLWAFMPGVALAALEPVVVGSARLRRLAAPGALVLLAILVAVGLYALAQRQGLWQRDLFAGVIATCAVGAPLLWQWGGRGAWAALDNRVMHWLGERSYSIYLVHNGILIALCDELREGRSVVELFWLALAAGLALSIALSALLYRYVELPALERRTRY